MPVVIGKKISAREPENSGTLLLQEGNSIRTEAPNVVGGHQRDCSDAKQALSGSGDFDPAVIRIPLGDKPQRVGGVRRLQPGQRKRLAFTRAGAPYHADRYLRAGSARQHNASGICLSFSKGDAGLPDASRFHVRKRKPWRVITHPRPVGIHGYGGVRPDRHPAVRSSAPNRSLLPWIRGDRVIEFPVVEHLRPNAPVYEIADMLDELSVQVRRNRSASLACINAHRHSTTRCAAGLGGGAENHEHCGQGCNEQTFHCASSSTKSIRAVIFPRLFTLPVLRPSSGSG
jgi:hypothetical protein